MVRFIHCSDLHLDTPFKGLSRIDPDLAAKQRKATSESFERIVGLCIEREVDFLIIAGDVYDSANRSVSTQIKFAKQLGRLNDIGMPVYLVCGNHDPLSEWLDAAKLPPNVHRFSSKEIERVTFEREGERVADIYGTSFEQKVVEENLAAKYELPADRAPVNIAVLHGTVGSPGSHAVYAQFSVDDVAAKGFDYWALGHIHKRHNVREAHPAIVYPGNPQGRDFGETGAKGCVLVEIEPGKSPSIEFIQTQTIRFEDVEIDITGGDDLNRLDSLIEDAAEQVDGHDSDCGYVYRITLRGRTSLHHHLSDTEEIDGLVEQLNEGGGTDIIDRIEIRTVPDLDLDAIRAGNDFPATVLRLADSYGTDEERLKGLFDAVDEDFKSAAAKRLMGDLPEDRMAGILNEAAMDLLTKLVEDAE
ncbi:MAG: DNA repair exonuclease [Acidobacteriota bacterium]|nr:MAG: DNA repair exonuclease [Acidobacteriota bacterium]